MYMYHFKQKILKKKKPKTIKLKKYKMPHHTDFEADLGPETRLFLGP